MDLEGLTLHYYLKIFSVSLISVFLSISIYISYLFNKEIKLNDNPLKIEKGEKIVNIISKNIYNYSKLDFEIIKLYIKINHFFKKKIIHYGDFNINDKASLFEFINTISQPSNILNKITIVEGWSKKQLNLELSKYFKDFHTIPYENIIADTYYFQNNISFESFLKKLKKDKQNYIETYQNNKIFNKFNQIEIMTIGSLLEKEGLDYQDKMLISSVIYNRLNIKMKLQIDATVIYSLTNGNYDLERKLLKSDLKINHPFNTYLYNGLPPKPISYVGKKTLDILFENYLTDFLFYFFDYSLNRHIFSKTFKEHKKKLNEYRNRK